MKKIFALSALALTLSLASCGSGSEPVPTDSDPPVTQIKGHVTAGSGTGTVTLTASQGTIAQAPVDAQGNFVLTLPSADKFAADLKTTDQIMSGIGCEGQLTSSVPAAKGYAAAVLNAERSGLKDSVYAANLNIQYLPPKGKLTAYAWLYTDQATHLTGNLNCSKLVNNALQINLEVDVQTRSGWNVIKIYAEGLQSFRGNMSTVREASADWHTTTELRSQLPF
ncbi:hypothetical protein [Deinococcus sp. PESE-13]